jgi:hypothetical protein
MTTNRLLTTAVQLLLAIPTIYLIRWMIADAKEMWRNG